MKKILSLILVLALALGLMACGAASGKGGKGGETTAAAGENGENGGNGGVFMAGFGMRDITPKDQGLPMASYGDERERLSTGLYSKLEARAVVLKDAEGNMLVFAVGDLSWCPAGLGNVIKQDMAAKLDIPRENIILSGTHTHASVATGVTDMPVVGRFNDRYIAGMEGAIEDAVADLKPAEVYVGSVMTEGMNFVRRYIMDDGSLTGDNAYGTGTEIVGHETEADPEVGMLKFVREGGKDILITNFQAHPHLEGKTTNLSAQTVGAIRDAVEAQLGAHSLHWQGAAGNLNTGSRIASESKYTKDDRVKYGQDMVSKYISKAYDSMEKVNAGTIKVDEVVFEGKTNHMYDHLTQQAQQIVDYFKDHTAGETATYAHELTKDCDLRINSYYHASRILGNAKLGAVQDIVIVAWSFGDVGGVVNAFEMFDTTGMYIKENSPFVRTFIVGYSYPGGGGYIPAEECFPRGGYEADNCMFAPGTAEEIADALLGLLNEQHK